MITLIEKHKFPEQSGLIPLLKKYDHGSEIILSSYLEEGDECDIGLYYGDEDAIFEGEVVICFTNADVTAKQVYKIDHPARTFVEKWTLDWNKKFIKWSVILENDLDFYEFKKRVIIRDTAKNSLRLRILQEERHIPVFDCEPQFHEVYEQYTQLRQSVPRCTEDNFIQYLITIIGRMYAKH